MLLKDIKQKVDQGTQWIEVRTLSISVMIGIATFLWIVANMYYSDLTAVGTATIKKTGKELGSLAVVCMLAAASYYLVREFFVRSRKKLPVMVRNQSLFTFSIVVLRRLHIWFGVLAISFVVDHGYLLWTIRKQVGFDKLVQTGFFAASVLIFLVLTGILIRFYPAVRQIRVGHRVLAFLVFAGIVMHKLIR
ncbi:heme A synthase [Sporomusaceae bacterium BoRhaA]|uniref:hypothetical protein n=1 Tax=Pelorhabdus rhamnosifermentans TaxID=2772457 RepID=UPI001C0610A5|nr:hypothetical protein [Pelorhabdus rhamnosifermentans]MBU2700718.1 heme A synthase [Pelorhabdus rhamnosifermentans]